MPLPAPNKIKSLSNSLFGSTTKFPKGGSDFIICPILASSTQ